MYLKVLTKETVSNGRTKDYKVRYFDSKSPEGRFELLKRYYGLKDLRKGSYFSLSIPIDDALYDWSSRGKEDVPN